MLPTADQAAIREQLETSFFIRSPLVIDGKCVPEFDSDRLRQAVALLKGCILLAHDTETSHHYIMDSLESVRLRVQAVTARADRSRQRGVDDIRRLLRASSMQLEVCIIGIRDVESVVKMLIAIARMRAALKLIEEAQLRRNLFF